MEASHAAAHGQNVGHPSGHHADIDKHVRTYVFVFVALLVLTLVTVAVAELKLNIMYAVIVAMFIATIKGSLVASYFMHLISEKKFIYLTLVITVVLFVVLMSLPLFTHADQVHVHVP